MLRATSTSGLGTEVVGLLCAQPGPCSPPVSMQRLKGDGTREPPAVERMNTPELEDEKRCGPRNRGLDAVKVRGVGVWVDRGAAGRGKGKQGAACPP